MSHILVVDDELSMRQLLEIALRKDGYHITVAESGGTAVDLFDAHAYDLVISDIKMPDMSGVEVLRHVKRSGADIPVIMITAYASTETAVEALRLGAYDYVTKPFKVDELKVTIRNALEKKKLREENIHLKRAMRQKHGLDSMVGQSPTMVHLFEQIRSVAPTTSTVLITGESGTGKELAARAIHVCSDRQSEPFVSVNCGAVSPQLIESELFGHEKGSFTGADRQHKGYFERAHGGSLFLDEITEMPLELQVKILRVLETGTLTRVGGSELIEVDVRVLAATNKDLDAAVRDKSFREDLFYRLNVIPIHVPALRERREDIPVLAEHFLAKARAEMKQDVRLISEEAMALMTVYDWPGNVRELENVIERAVALETMQAIQPERLPDKIRILGGGGADKPDEAELALPEDGVDFQAHVASLEKRLLSLAMKRAGGVQTKAAKLLRMNLRSFRYLLQKYGLR